jgi:hypothetical protein
MTGKRSSLFLLTPFLTTEQRLNNTDGRTIESHGKFETLQPAGPDSSNIPVGSDLVKFFMFLKLIVLTLRQYL